MQEWSRAFGIFHCCLHLCEEDSKRYSPLGEVPAVDVTQVVPVSVVATQLLLRVLEISKLPSSVLERAGGCLGCVFRVVLSSILRLPLDFLEV